MIRFIFLVLFTLSLHADSLEFNLKSFADLVSSQHKINIFVDDDLVKNDNFSFYLQSEKEIVLLDAFKQMLNLKNLEFIKKKNFYYIKKFPEIDKSIFLPKPHLYAIKLDSLVFDDFKPFLDSYKDRLFYSYIKNTNTIFLNCLPSVYKEILPLIKANDAKAEQFQIKITIVETNNNFAKDRGADISLHVANSSPSESYFINLLTLGSPSNVSLSSNIGLSASLKFLDSIGVSKILTSPYFTVESGKKIDFSSADNIPFQSSTSLTNGATQTTNQSVSYKDVGLIISLTPKLVGDTIFVDLDFKNESIIDDSTLTPKTSKISLTTSFQLKRNGLQVLTGLDYDKKVDTTYGIPFFMKLPYVGQIFRFDSVSHTKKSLSIMVEIK